jgi:membrane protease YdiL (CAAX protease family)
MRYSTAILIVVLGYTWLIAPITPRWASVVPVVLVLGIAISHAFRTGEWGWRSNAFLPALAWVAVTSAAGVLVAYVAGMTLGTWHHRRDPWLTFAALVPWALGQQFALQTVLLREAQHTTSRSAGVWMAALLFGALHLPNPFLAPATTVAAAAWCWIYDRYPNIIPPALSHAALTLAVLYAFDDAITGRLRVGVAYFELK